MLARQFTHILLRPEDIPPTRDDMEVIGVFNPGAIATPEGVVILARVAERPKEKRPGCVGLPRWRVETGLEIDWVREEEITWPDPRVCEFKRTKLIRLSFASHLRVILSRDGRTIDTLTDVRLLPEAEHEEYGLEDPRLTRIGETYYFTYVAVSRHGAATALASTRDFRSFERHGIIFPPENKDVVLFPDPLDGRYVALHRPNPATPFSPPEMWIAASSDLRHWGDHAFFLRGSTEWDRGRIGAGTPPVRTDEGWLEIYHGSGPAGEARGVGAYAAAALLLDPADPRRIRRRSRGPILRPELPFEREGFVAEVVFPTGLIEQDDLYLVYYGASDTYCGGVGLSRKQLLQSLIEM